MTSRPLNLELFACSGGMAEGFRRAGVEFDFVFDYDPDACDSYEANLGRRPIRMDVRDLVRLARGGWRPGPVGLLIADPPCTPWSRAGKRLGTADERDMLEETAELIGLLRPTAYLIGNIPGLQDAPSWPVVQRIIGGLRKHGYCVADFTELDAADYGVPQHRVRPFWYGHLDGACIRWPLPTHGDPSHLALPGLALKPWVTCREALQHLPLEQLGRPVRMKIRPARVEGGKNGGDVTRCSSPDDPARVVVTRDASKGGQILIPNDAHPASTLDAPARGVRASRANTGLQGGGALILDVAEPRPNHPPSTPDAPSMVIKCNGGRASQASSTLKLEAWPWSRPCTTVTTTDRCPPPGHHPESSSVLSGPNAVVLSERAAAILQGFDESWRFCGATKKTRWSQIGMAVPPAVGEAIARSIVAAQPALFNRPEVA